MAPKSSVTIAVEDYFLQIGSTANDGDVGIVRDGMQSIFSMLHKGPKEGLAVGTLLLLSLVLFPGMA